MKDDISLTVEQCADQFEMYAATHPSNDSKHSLRFCAKFIREFCRLPVTAKLGTYSKLHETIKRLQDQVELLNEEVARLKQGDFTPEEFQTICHHRDDKPGCTKEEFFDGCCKYQEELFGVSERRIMKSGVDMLATERELLKSDLAEERAQNNRLLSTLQKVRNALGGK